MSSVDHERVLEQLLAYTTALIEITDSHGRLLQVNDRWVEVTGYSRQEATGKTPAELLRSHLHDRAFYDAMWDTVSNKRVWQGELISRGKDGTFHHMLTTVVPLLDDAGEIHQFVAIKRPISTADAVEPVEAEAESSNSPLVQALTRLRISEQRYRAMMQAACDAILVADFDTALIVDANPAACEMFGYTVVEFRQLTGRMLTAPEDRHLTEGLSDGIINRGTAQTPRMRVCRKDGSRFWASLRMATYELAGQQLYVVSLRDVSEQVQREAELAESNERLRAAQERLRQSERLAALGQLSAAVAHEINNPLQFIEVNLNELRKRLEHRKVPRDLASLLDDVRDGVSRISNITRDLASFARIDRDKITEVDLDEVVERACRMARTEIRHRARLELRLASRRTLCGDRGKLTQLVTNLVVNASHAIEEGKANSNRITLMTKQQGDSLLLSVEDTGTGISPELTKRIFEPFFTTKPAGHGGGLGLAVCSEIVRLHRGTIEVHSTPGRGSRFEIRLPFDNGLMAPTEPDPPPVAAPQQRGRVLLIDDDALVLRGLRRLVASKHDVVAAQGGDAGLKILKEDRAFDVILCDLMMPVVDGLAVHEAVKHSAPELLERLVFCSGGAFTQRAQEFVSSAINPMLKKPIRGTELFTAIERIMSRNTKTSNVVRLV